MAIVACPGCKTPLEIPETPGEKVECPICQRVLRIAPVPPPASREIAIDPCPKCEQQLMLDPVHLGSNVECPSCKTTFVAMNSPIIEESPLAATPAKADVSDEKADLPKRREEDEDDDLPKKRKKKRRESSRMKEAKDLASSAKVWLMVGFIGMCLPVVGLRVSILAIQKAHQAQELSDGEFGGGIAIGGYFQAAFNLVMLIVALILKFMLKDK